MAKEQLTVAELLERAKKDNPEAVRSKPRRRRSLEEGGISVAELTGSFKAVDAAPPEAKHSSVPLDDPEKDKAEAERRKLADAKAAAQARREAEEQRIKEEKRAAQQAAEAERARQAQRKAEREAAEREAVAEQPAPSSDETAVFTRVEAEEDDEATGSIPVVPAESEAVERDILEALEEAEEEEDEETGPNVGAVIGLAVLGVILGVIIFLGFELMWSTLNRTLVALLAVAVTIIMVVAVRAMRTNRDRLTMTLAAIVGIVVTFGPAIVAL